jgi:hypothetical protein
VGIEPTLLRTCVLSMRVCCGKNTRIELATSKKTKWGDARIELATSCTLSKNHTTRPITQVDKQCVRLEYKAVSSLGTTTRDNN